MGIAFVDHFGNVAHIVGSKISVESAAAHDLLVNLFLGVLTGKAHLNQGSGGNGARSLGRKSSVAVKCIEHVNYPALFMSANGNAAAHMYHDQIQGIVSHSLFLCVAFCDRLLVQCVEHAGAGKLRNTGISCDGHEFVNHHGIHDIGGDSDGIADFPGKDTAKIGSVLPLLTDLEILQKLVADCVGAAGNGF